MPEALIFDVDGTLAETEELHREAFNATFAEAGLGWHWDRELYARLLRVTGGKERIRHFMDGLDAPPPLDSAAVVRLHAAKSRRYADRVAGGGLTLRPGVARLLDEAEAAGLRLAVATTTGRPNVEALLDSTLGAGAAGRFAVIAAGDAVPAKKPAPDVYLLALAELGLPAGRCVAFEDSAPGLAAAAGAGIATVITVAAYTADHAFPGALAVLDHLGEPGRPCRASVGRAPAGGYVTVEDLRTWLAAG